MMITHYSYQRNRFIIGLRVGLLLLGAIIFFIAHGPALTYRTVIAIYQRVVPAKTVVMSDHVLALQAKIQDLENTNARLTSTLTRLGENKKALILARIVLGGGYLFSDTLSLDHGADSGIELGDYVTTNDGIIIGTIAMTGSGWSAVTTLTQRGRKIIIRAGEHKDIIFEATGIGGEEIQADLPVTIKIKPGDIAWFGEKSDYIVGIIDRLDTSSARQIQSVFIKPPLAFKALTNVEIYHK